MRPAYQVDILFFKEVWDHIWAKYETDPSLVFAPSLDALFRVSPEEIAEKALIWYLNGPDNFKDLFEALQLRTEPTMHTENFLIDKGGYRHDIKNIREEFPEFKIVFSFT